MNELSRNLDEYIEEKGITLKKLSEQTGIKYTTLNDLARGRTINPKIETMEMLEKATNVDLNLWLYGKELGKKKEILRKIGIIEIRQRKKEMEILEATINAMIKP